MDSEQKQYVLGSSFKGRPHSPRREEDADINIAVFPGPGGVPAELTLLGNPAEKSEQVVAYEAGYRAQPKSPFSADLAAFFNTYTNLATTESGSPFLVVNPPPAHLVFPLVWGNKMKGTTVGIEVSGNWKVNDHWMLSPGYALLQMHLHPTPQVRTQPPWPTLRAPVRATRLNFAPT